MCLLQHTLALQAHSRTPLPHSLLSARMAVALLSSHVIAPLIWHSINQCKTTPDVWANCMRALPLPSTGRCWGMEVNTLARPCPKQCRTPFAFLA
jgi:hypothetical protein